MTRLSRDWSRWSARGRRVMREGMVVAEEEREEGAASRASMREERSVWEERSEE